VITVKVGKKPKKHHLGAVSEDVSTLAHHFEAATMGQIMGIIINVLSQAGQGGTMRKWQVDRLGA
jgi:hypothetical protein